MRAQHRAVDHGADGGRTFGNVEHDEATAGLGGVKRSCVHFVEPDGKIYPFDTFNTFYREGAVGRLAFEARAT